MPRARAEDPPSPSEPVPFEPFALVRSLASTSTGTKLAPEELLRLSLGVFLAAGALSASLVAGARARTKHERDLPRGTHWRAAAHASRALLVASAATGALAGVVVVGARELGGLRTVSDVRATFRSATRDAVKGLLRESEHGGRGGGAGRERG